ncbi:hypothetical protein ANN_27386 [Periplaneta americana]|uniref:Uncharacterized protein n=1 Tax=Periplaneta americana TaxID=6978 RepID=A0ABQ8RVS5_PERAM|nr:hypothetical protein ANN_27386 [Periplaneta americana]
MAGLCEGGSEPSGSLKAICKSRSNERSGTVPSHLPRVASRRKFHDELELPTIDEFIARLARNLYAEARANPNPLISGLGQYDPRLRRRHQTGPLAILLRQEDREAGVTPRFW